MGDSAAEGEHPMVCTEHKDPVGDLGLWPHPEAPLHARLLQPPRPPQVAGSTLSPVMCCSSPDMHCGEVHTLLSLVAGSAAICSKRFQVHNREMLFTAVMCHSQGGHLAS